MNFNHEFENKPNISPIGETDKNTPTITLVISSDTIGVDDKHFGRQLLNSFLFSLTEIPPKINSIILFNRAVKLAFKNSPVLEPLKLLYESSIDVIICKESLKNHGGKELLAIGKEASMYHIVNMLISAEKIISI
ncbi:hypothetical protein J7L67_07795 [bacterium]|nr:hypothetical protein [bacterium]